jgi:hypothetical protein
VPRGRFCTLKWPSRSVKTLRKIPAARDFRLTATWVAGRLSDSRSTVPEISPPAFSKLDTCALALGVQTIDAMYRKKLRTRSGGKVARRNDFSTLDTSSCILTYRALLRGASGDLAVAGVNPCGREKLLPSLSPRLRSWFRQRRRCTLTPRCQPSRAEQILCQKKTLCLSRFAHSCE